MNRKRKELFIAGSGGQGIILAGHILSKAASLKGLKVTQTQNYGPEARGGSSKCEVIISMRDIAFPKVTKPDIAVFLTTASYEKFVGSIKENTLVLMDGLARGKGESVPFRGTCRQYFDTELFANSILLGYLAARFNLAEKEYFYQALELLIPAAMEKNKEAFKIGYRMGKEVI
ncbi:2-oxoacid:acceptor oxidoreductase family protein [Alkalicella caledoniensis]|uniref:2-oxoacid:acceptor oxidoreductase family protein n=1 Tax=Alkalicella caledoniensis TaxID=2731377 RepID=A0A7G9W5E8_ALKCA|nr:2-oxoacid:acceptor oxidoreductase family protein [Alkalicella caledoniensis]QNO13910.1 2-oxoacid:acceptor oxidoreductase family protein [Alkalicella caledoniensis]